MKGPAVISKLYRREPLQTERREFQSKRKIAMSLKIMKYHQLMESLKSSRSLKMKFN